MRHVPVPALFTAVAALMLASPCVALAAAPATPAPAPPAPTEASSPPSTPALAAAPPAATAPASTPAPAAPQATPPTPTAPQVQAQHAQSATPGGPGGAGRGGANAGGSPPSGSTGGSQAAGERLGHLARPPVALTPSLPLSLTSSISGVPGFFIESFRIPPFLLSIYQAAGTAYGIPWQVLAAINEVETDYGRVLSVSSAGAEGWMQFLPAVWAQYGVDANGDGLKDPYNPADAIFAASRYLRAAGGDTNIRAAVFAYNHSQGYVESVMLRAQLLGGTPPGLLGAITGLTQARFPVHARSHFSDGFATAPASRSRRAVTLVGTTIYSQAGAPVVAVQDGQIVRIGASPSLGRFVSLRDAYGNTYTYAQLGKLAALYPVLQPHDQTTVSSRIARPGEGAEAPPRGPATAGAQPRSPLSEAADVSGLALGAAAGLEPPPTPAHPAPAVSAQPAAPPKQPPVLRSFRAGPNDVYLHPLRAGAQVIAGTVLGHLATGARRSEPHIVFQIRPAGNGAPLIDPKPVLDGWVALENTSIFRARGQNPYLATSPTVGQVLLESKQQLEPQVLRDRSIRLSRCARQAIQSGRVDKRVLVVLEFLSVSGLRPSVSGLACGGPASARAAAAPAGYSAAEITAVNGITIAGHQGPGSIADTTVRKLLSLQGVSRPLAIVSLQSYPGAANTLASPSAARAIHVSFTRPRGALARAAGALESALSPAGWLKLIARLGEIPNPTVASKPSAAAIPDTSGAPGASGGSSGGPSSTPSTAPASANRGRRSGGNR